MDGRLVSDERRAEIEMLFPDQFRSNEVVRRFAVEWCSPRWCSCSRGSAPWSDGVVNWAIEVGRIHSIPKTTFLNRVSAGGGYNE